MPWVGVPVPVTTTSGLNWLVELLRIAVSDSKFKVNNVTFEDNGATFGGGVDETYYTTNLPITDNTSTYMRVGRWFYEAVTTVSEAQGERAYIFNATSGSYFVPDGAITGETGDAIKLSYSWTEEQSYNFSDGEMALWIEDAVATVNQSYYNFGHIVSGVGSTYEIYPCPSVSDLSSYLYVKYATYLIMKRLEAEGYDNRIFVKDLNVTIDTTRGLSDLAKSSKTLLNEVQDVVNTLNIDGQNSAVGRIDVYSTYVSLEGLNMAGAQFESNTGTNKDYYYYST